MPKQRPLTRSPFRKSMMSVRSPCKKPSSIRDRRPQTSRKLFDDEDDESDKDFVCDPSPVEMGKLIEYHLAKNGVCPFCSARMLLFKSPSMPLVDMICPSFESHIERSECFLWQIKTAGHQNTYFSANRIPIGSSALVDRLLQNKSDTVKDSVIGFVLIVLTRSNQIDPRRSMILIPDLAKELEKPEAFYSETTKNFFGKRCIAPNYLLITSHRVSKMIDHTIKVNPFREYHFEDYHSQK